MKRLLLIALLLAPVIAIAGEQVTVKLDNTPLLATPASGAETIATLGRGETLDSSGSEGGYYKVIWKGKTGYVLKFRVNAATTPAAPVDTGAVGELKGMSRVARVDEAATGHSIRGFTGAVEGADYVAAVGAKVAGLDKVAGCTFTLTGAMKAEGKGEPPCRVTVSTGLVATMENEATLAGVLAFYMGIARGADEAEADQAAVLSGQSLGYDPTPYRAWLATRAGGADRVAAIDAHFPDLAAKGERGEERFKKAMGN